MPNEAFFSSKSQTFGFGQAIWAVNFGAFGVFSADSCPCFPLIDHYFYKKLSLYIQIKSRIFIWDWDLNLGCKEFGI
jgi:hypothetical protein